MPRCCASTSIEGGGDDDAGDTRRAHTESTPYAVEEFDQLLAATAGSPLLQQLRATAFGQEFTGLETWSNTTWWLLGRLVARSGSSTSTRSGRRTASSAPR